MRKYFFVPTARDGQCVKFEGDAAHHLLQVMRVRVGDAVVLCDGAGMDYAARLSDADRQKLTAKFEILSETPCETEPPVKIHLYAALLKGERMDLLVQKCVELGVHEITPVTTRHTVVRKGAGQLPRLQRVSAAAAGQSGRGIIPTVNATMPFEKAAAGADGLSIVAHETERDVYIMKEMVGAAGKISLWIGPEGGFAPDEIEKLRQAGAHVVTLGRRILRAETAAMAAVAQILLLCEGASV